MTYRAGIVGAGGIAGMGILGMHDAEDIGRKKFRASHAGGYEAAEGIDLVAVADLDESKLERFCSAWEIPEAHRYTDPEAMLAEEDIDALSVCTPTLHHHDPVVAAAESGEPDVVWCEKPIASGVSEAEAMVDACADADVELVVNHSFRFTEKLQWLRENLAALVGDVHSVTTTFRMELMRNSTHLIDSLVYLLDARADRVAGHVTGENEAVDALDADRRVDDAGGGGFLVTEDGTFVTVDCTVPREASSMAYQIVGDAGKLYLNNDDGEWRHWALVDGDHVERDLPIDSGWAWERDYEAAFPNAARHVVDLLDGEAENLSPGTDAVRSLEVIVGFYVSHYTGSRVSIPLADPLTDVRVTSW